MSDGQKRKFGGSPYKKHGKFGSWPRVTANFDPRDNRADQFMDYNEFDKLEHPIRNRKKRRRANMDKRR